MTAKSPLSQFTRVAGRYGTLGTFVPAIENNQESVTGDSSRIAVDCYHSKLYTVDKPVTLQLGNGIQDGQLKRLTFIYMKGDATVTVECPALASTNSEIIFSAVGDQALLLWTGGSWCVLETLNITDPSLQSPWVQ